MQVKFCLNITYAYSIVKKMPKLHLCTEEFILAENLSDLKKIFALSNLIFLRIWAIFKKVKDLCLKSTEQQSHFSRD